MQVYHGVSDSCTKFFVDVTYCLQIVPLFETSGGLCSLILSAHLTVVYSKAVTVLFCETLTCADFIHLQSLCM